MTWSGAGFAFSCGSSVLKRAATSDSVCSGASANLCTTRRMVCERCDFILQLHVMRSARFFTAARCSRSPPLIVAIEPERLKALASGGPGQEQLGVGRTDVVDSSL